MRVVTVAEMQEMDRTAIEDYGIPGVVLMENAGRQVVTLISREMGDLSGQEVAIIAGKGNNGGDGFVIARHLKNMGARVSVFLMAGLDDITGDARVNLDIWLRMGGQVRHPWQENIDLAGELGRVQVIVDALYGTGFQGAVRENVLPLLRAVNKSPALVVAVDVPSGLEAATGYAGSVCVRADHTVTFALPKIGLVTGDGPEYTGRLQVVDISIPQPVTAGGQVELITPGLVKNILPQRPLTAHKGTCGHALIIGGSPGMSGAVCLAAQACARTGAGLVTALVPWGLLPVLEIKLTEVMTKPLPETLDGFLSASAREVIREFSAGKNVLAIGPGLGTKDETLPLVADLLREAAVPCVVDADGINAIARVAFDMREMQAPAVLTPHPGEMARLAGCSTAEVQADRLGIARRLAEKTGAVLVLKGAGTIVAVPGGKAYINSSGNPGLATGGTGDVLTGIIAGLIAQGVQPAQAAVAGVYMHGLAGDQAAAVKGQAGILAGDVIEHLPGKYLLGK